MSAEPTPKPDKFGIALRVGLFVLIAWVSLRLFARLFALIIGVQEGYFILSVFATFSAAALANAITVRVYERGRLSDLGLNWTNSSLNEFLMGGACAAAAAMVIITGPLLIGAANFVPAEAVEHRWASFIFVTVLLLFGAAGEEMLFHGYAFQLLIRFLGPFATILPTSVIFGLAHLPNQNVTILGILNTVLWGVLLGYAYLRTRTLWLPIGLHFGWNFALPLFGVNLSGFTIGLTGYALRWRTADLWSGGSYGPEGSLLTTVIVVVLFFAVQRLFPERESE